MSFEGTAWFWEEFRCQAVARFNALSRPWCFCSDRAPGFVSSQSPSFGSDEVPTGPYPQSNLGQIRVDGDTILPEGFYVTGPFLVVPGLLCEEPAVEGVSQVATGVGVPVGQGGRGSRTWPRCGCEQGSLAGAPQCRYRQERLPGMRLWAGVGRETRDDRHSVCVRRGTSERDQGGSKMSFSGSGWKE